MKKGQNFLLSMPVHLKRAQCVVRVLFWWLVFSLGATACINPPTPVMTDTPTPALTATPVIGSPTPAFQGTPVPFETIERVEYAETGEDYEGLEPIIVVLTGTGDIELLGETISTKAHQALQQVDFGEDFVVGIFQGQKPTNGYGVHVLQVTRMNHHLEVYAELIQPLPNIELSAVMTSPYELIRVSKEGFSGTIQVDLIVNDEVIQQTEATIN